MKVNAVLIVTAISTVLAIYFLNLYQPLSTLLLSGIALFVVIYAYLLYIDYSLIVMNRHALMPYFYLVFLAAICLSSSLIVDNDILLTIRYVLWAVVGVVTGMISVYSYMNIEKMHQGTEASRSGHLIHTIADEVEKRTSPEKSWELHAYDFFEEKLGRFFGK